MDLLVRGLAVWRISTMLVQEYGFGGLLAKLRVASGIRYDANDEPYMWSDWTPLHCLYCTSIWVGVVIAMLPRWVSMPFALSAIAALTKDGKDKWL